EGDAYVSGRDLFFEGSHFVWEITDSPSEENVEPPLSLHRAMRLFFISAAAGEAADPPLDICSMMVHPSERVAQHERYRGLVEAYRDRCHDALRDPARSDHDDVVTAFRQDYADLSHTANLPPFDRLLPRLPTVIKDCAVRVLNAQNLNEDIP